MALSDGSTKRSVLRVVARAFQAALLVAGCSLAAGEQPPAAPPLIISAVRPIEPARTPLPTEAASAGVTKFSFIAYGDTRSSGVAEVPGDGQIVHPEHSRLVDRMIVRIRERASTAFPIRFILQSGDAVLRG